MCPAGGEHLVHRLKIKQLGQITKPESCTDKMPPAKREEGKSAAFSRWIRATQPLTLILNFNCTYIGNHSNFIFYWNLECVDYGCCLGRLGESSIETGIKIPIPVAQVASRYFEAATVCQPIFWKILKLAPHGLLTLPKTEVFKEESFYFIFLSGTCDY